MLFFGKKRKVEPNDIKIGEKKIEIHLGQIIELSVAL